MRHAFEVSAVFCSYAVAIAGLWLLAVWLSWWLIEKSLTWIKLHGAFREWLFGVYFKRMIAEQRAKENA